MSWAQRSTCQGKVCHKVHMYLVYRPTMNGIPLTAHLLSTQSFSDKPNYPKSQRVQSQLKSCALIPKDGQALKLNPSNCLTSFTSARRWGTVATSQTGEQVCVVSRQLSLSRVSGHGSVESADAVPTRPCASEPARLGVYESPPINWRTP